jgi:hypothetical protein
MNIYELGKQMAEEFKERGSDVFVEIVKVGEEEVTVSLSYTPKTKPITNEDIWKGLVAQHQ